MSSALETVNGVIKAEAFFETKTAKVKAKGSTCHDKGQKDLIKALKEAGYDGKVTSVE